jgi:sugar O-acyltransferase (sialic acid O-acetyltransferase NeuD family)
MKPIVIFGTGDIARLAQVYFTRDAKRAVAGFTVDRAFRGEGDTYLGAPLVDFEEVDRRFPPLSFDGFVALSYREMNRLRAAKYAAMKERGYDLASYVSSRCSWLTDEPAGDNCFILEDNTVQPFVKIGSNVTLWSGNHIGHDSVIEDHCFISSHVVVSGHVRIRSFCFLGVNSTLRNGITLAPQTLVGAGAVIMKDTMEKGVYMPQRAELFKKKSDEIDL